MMDEELIAALAEAEANMDSDRPTLADFRAAEERVRQRLAEGAIFDPEHGWLWPAQAS